jgi:DNA repair exonuclease SbcCD ATPase subunit
MKYNKAVGQKDLLTKQLGETIEKLEESEQYFIDCQKVRAYVQIVAEQTQKKIEYHISNLVSMALSAVFPDPYEFSLQFVQRRNKTEADLIFKKDGNEGDPLDISGGGALDVASFALRAATWSIKPSRKVLLLDEPGKFISRDLQEKFGEMLKTISTKLGIQLIVISHIPEIISYADKVFNTTNIKGETIVK